MYTRKNFSLLPLSLLFFFSAGVLGATENPCAPPNPTEVVAVAASVAPLSPANPLWDDVPSMEITLFEQLVTPPVGGGSTPTIHVQAIHDGEWVSFRLTWLDDTENDSVGVDTFRDTVAVGFPIDPAVFPSPFMGDATNGVSIWQWTANSQADAEGRGKFDEMYPSTEGVWYFPQDEDISNLNEEWRGHLPADAYIAYGFGTLERSSQEGLTGMGLYAEESWRVVIRNRLDGGMLPLSPEGLSKMIFAVWDGAENEVNGRKSVTLMWTPFVLSPLS
ncbi:hypothetical protein H8D30_06855 [bacterium]|nr:hypothetical protein [bacterium]